MINLIFLMSPEDGDNVLKCIFTLSGEAKWGEGFSGVDVGYHFSGWRHQRLRKMRWALITQSCVSSHAKEQSWRRKSWTSFTHCHRIHLTSRVFSDNIIREIESFSQLKRSLPSRNKIITIMVPQQRIYYGSQRAAREKLIKKKIMTNDSAVSRRYEICCWRFRRLILTYANSILICQDFSLWGCSQITLVAFEC